MMEEVLRPKCELLSPAGQSCRAHPSNPQCVAGDGVFWRKTQNTVSGICGILVFWYSGLAPLKTRFLGRRPIYLARGGLDFWPKNVGGWVPEGQVPGLQTSHFTLG